MCQPHYCLLLCNTCFHCCVIDAHKQRLADRPFQAIDDADQLVGVVVSKLEPHRGGPLRGYIAMLAVRVEWRGRGIATKLVRRALDAMIERDAEEVCSFLKGDDGVLIG
jgi:ribosomal protein S18 acetylase RimI-like enzyme